MLMVIDADYEPTQSIPTATSAEHIDFIEVIPETVNNNSERIKAARAMTDHTWAEVKEIKCNKVSPLPGSDLSADQVRELIRWMLADYGVKRRRFHEETAYALTTELINKLACQI